MEKRTQSDSPRKEVLQVAYDQSISQEEVFSKMETTELEIMPDLISFAIESVESTKLTKVVNSTETATSNPTALIPLEHVISEVVNSLILPHGIEKLYRTCEALKNVPEHVITKKKPEFVDQSKLKVCETAGHPPTAYVESVKSKEDNAVILDKASQSALSTSATRKCLASADTELVELKELEIIGDTALNVAQETTIVSDKLGKDELSAKVFKDSESAISSDSQNNSRNDAFIKHQSSNQEVESLKDFDMSFTEIRKDSLMHSDQPSTNPTTKLGDTLQTTIITIEDSFEERPCNQLETTEESLKSTKAIVSPKTNNLITQHVINCTKPTENIQRHNMNNSVMIINPNNKCNDSVTAHIVPVDDSKAKTASRDSFVVNTNEHLEDNADETSKIDLSPQCTSKSEETVNMKPGVECDSGKTEVSTNNEIIIIDDSFTENSITDDCMDSVADIDKTSPAISVESSDAEQDELSEDEKIQPITRKSADVNETFVTCTLSLVADASLEYTNFEAAITNPSDIDSRDSIELGITEDIKTRSPEALNSTENCLVAALEALNINCDDKDDTFLSCQENFDLSSIERSFSLKSTKTADEGETYIKITKSVFCKSNGDNTEEAPVSETIQFPKLNIEHDSTGSDSNSSCETVILKEKKSDFSVEATDVSLTKSETLRSQTSQTTNSRINNEVKFEEVSKSDHTSASTVEQVVMESTNKTSYNELIVEDDTMEKMAKAEDVETILAIKFVPSNSPQASSSLILKNEADVEEAPIIVSSESFVEQAPVTTETIKNASCCEGPLEDNKMDISTGADEVLPMTFNLSTNPQANSPVLLKNEADTEEASNICSSELFAKQETVKSTKNSSCQTIPLEEGPKTVVLSPELTIEEETFEDNKMDISTGDVCLTEADPSKKPQVNNSSISKTDVNVEEIAKTVVESTESTVTEDNIQSIKNTSCGNTSLEHNTPAFCAEADVWSRKFDQSNGPQASSSMIEVNAGETSNVVDGSPEYNIEQRSPMTVILEDNETDLSVKMDETNKVSPIKMDLSNTPQDNNLTNEASDEETPRIVKGVESNNEQNTIVGNKDTFDETVTNENNSNLSAEADDVSPAKSFVSADVSISSCDTPERSLLSYSSLMEASPSIFAQQVTRYEKQSHLKLRINELEQSLAKLKLQLRQKEAVIMNLQMEKIKTVKQEEKIHKAPVSADDIITIKKLGMYEEKLQEANLKIAELEKLENEKCLLETKLKVQEEDYTALEKKYEEIKLQLKTYEQKNFDMILEVERAEREKKKVLETLQQYEAVLLQFTTDKNNLKACLEEVMLKYERAKSLILGFKNNEDAYKKENDDLRDKLKTFAEQYENFKLQALAEIDAANKENLNLREQLRQEKERKVKKLVGKK